VSTRVPSGRTTVVLVSVRAATCSAAPFCSAPPTGSAAAVPGTAVTSPATSTAPTTIPRFMISRKAVVAGC
jgi:hypothetical protein